MSDQHLEPHGQGKVDPGDRAGVRCHLIRCTPSSGQALRKYCENITVEDLVRWHGEHSARFRQLAVQHDPEGKFSNEFTKRLFASPNKRHDVHGVEHAA